MATKRSNLTPSLLPDDVGELIVTALQAEAIAAEISVVHISDRQQVVYPVITDDLASAWVGESEQIQLSDVGTREVNIQPAKVIAATRISNEALEDSDPAAAQILAESIGRSLASKVDEAVLGAAAGLVAPEGLGKLTGFTDVGSSNLTDLDGFHRGLAAVRDRGATPTAIVTSNATALRLALMRESGGTTARRSLLQPDPTAPTTYAVGGVPIVSSRHVSDTAAYIVPRDRLRLVIRKGATLEVDRSVFALTRETLVLGEARVGFGVLHAAAVAKLTLTS